MLLYRIASQKYISDLTGIGAKTVGGRWNPKGVAILYTSTSISLSVLEVLVHLPAAYLPRDMAMATIRIPDQDIPEVSTEDLPEHWNVHPPNRNVQEFLIGWIQSRQSLAIKLPSVIVPTEYNCIINPMHPDFPTVVLENSQPFSFDSRLV